MNHSFIIHSFIHSLVCLLAYKHGKENVNVDGALTQKNSQMLSRTFPLDTRTAFHAYDIELSATSSLLASQTIDRSQAPYTESIAAACVCFCNEAYNPTINPLPSTNHFLCFERLLIRTQIAHIALILRIVLRSMLPKTRHRQKRFPTPCKLAHKHLLPIHYTQSRGSDSHSCVFTCSRRLRSDLNSFPQPGN